MAISPSLKRYLNERGIPFEELLHAKSLQAAQSAKLANVDEARVAKGVLLNVDDDLLLAVIPASRSIDYRCLSAKLRRKVSLAGEASVAYVLTDCEVGAVPPVGGAFGLQTILDDEILAADDIYFEGGDHRTLVHVSATDWRRLMSDADHCAFAV